MIIMDLKLDNILHFNNFHINFSYPKRIVNSSIEETLEGFPNFRYKKVNILMGGNASGKTSLGKVILRIFHFLNKFKDVYFNDLLSDTSREGRIEIVFIPDGKNLCYLHVDLNQFQDEELSLGYQYHMIPIQKRDSYERAYQRLISTLYDVSNEEKEIPQFGWNFTFPTQEWDVPVLNIGNHQSNIFDKVLKILLMTLDNSIIDVQKLDDVENSYVIIFKTFKLIIQDGEVIRKDILSSGTQSGIAIASLISNLLEHNNGFYYCDEKFSYIHSDIEKAMLSIMASCVNNTEQLFFTTHNLEIATMDFPKHSFNFIRKHYKEDIYIDVVSASKYLKKNTDIVKNAIDNDVFLSSPDISALFELEEYNRV